MVSADSLITIRSMRSDAPASAMVTCSMKPGLIPLPNSELPPFSQAALSRWRPLSG